MHLCSVQDFGASEEVYLVVRLETVVEADVLNRGAFASLLG